MARLDQARARLEAAITRLETVLSARGREIAGGDGGATHAAIVAECVQLRGELSDLQAEQARLRALAGRVGAELDATIARIDDLTGE